MNEVEKMYSNAHVYPRVYGDITKETFENKVFNMGNMCNEAFTAEKQIELIKWLTLNDFIDNLTITFRPFELMWVFQIYTVTEFAIEKCASRMGADMTFEKGLASLINNLWQDLTEEERKQIKEILE